MQCAPQHARAHCHRSKVCRPAVQPHRALKPRCPTPSVPPPPGRASTSCMAGFIYEAIKGIADEVEATGSYQAVPGSLKAFGTELAALLPLIPTGVRLAWMRGRLTALDEYLNDEVHHRPKYDVLLHRSQPYSSGERHTLDIYVPLSVAQQLKDKKGKRPSVPVLFYTHGGVWASGEPWHYVSMGIRMAQTGCVVVMNAYTLYPQALVPQMMYEVSTALSWVLQHIHEFGGDRNNVTASGHSAGGHLVALALLHRAGVPVVPAIAATSDNPSDTTYEPSPQPNRVAINPSLPDELQIFDEGWEPPAPYPDLLVQDSAMPARFLALAGVFDIDKHFAHERLRGVHIISMMKRAMGGFRNFHSLSPTMVLAYIAHGIPLPGYTRPPSRPLSSPDAQVAADETGMPTYTQDISGVVDGVGLSQLSQPGSYYQSFTMLGDAITHRVLGVPRPRPLVEQHPSHTDDGYSSTSTIPGTGRHSHSASGGAQRAVGWDSGPEDVDLREVVRRLPPCFIMAGCSDHVVPWHESAEFRSALTSCGVPTRLLLYQKATHACFVTSWIPLNQELPVPDAQSLMTSHEEPIMAGMTDWGKDVARVVFGAVNTTSPVLSQVGSVGAQGQLVSVMSKL